MKITIDTSGLDELSRRLKRLEQPENVPLGELLNPSFIRQHSPFNNLDELISRSGLGLKTAEDVTANKAQLDIFICSNTQYATWEELLSAAAAERIKTKLRL